MTQPTASYKARNVGIFCIMISCEIPRQYRDIVAEFHNPFTGFSPSCSSYESARKLTTSVSPFLLLHGGCSPDCLSRPVCSTSSYTAQHFVHMCNWYSEEGTGWGCSLPSPLLAVLNVTAHPSTANVLITVLRSNGLLLCDFNVLIKG